MDQHSGVACYYCPSCGAQVTWWASEARDGPGAGGNARRDLGPLCESVQVERWLPEQRKLVKLGVELLVQPGNAIDVLDPFLFPRDPDGELTLAEAVAQIPTIAGEAAGEVAADLARLIAPDGDCDLCAELFGALFGLLVAILLEPIVAHVLLFLEGVSVLSALLPGGDVEHVGMDRIKHFTHHIIERGLDYHLKDWEGIVRLCAGAALAVRFGQVAGRQQDAYQQQHPSQRAALTGPAAGRGEADEYVMASPEYQDQGPPAGLGEADEYVMASPEYQDQGRATEGPGFAGWGLQR
jgi:hypothetical protein